jgi:K+-transporting ATPase ATPase C chain
MRRQLLTGLRMILAMTVLCGLAYPLLVLGVSQIAFRDKANGSMVSVNGTEVGSSQLGQNFTDAKYFQPRPSAAGTDGYDGLASAASNLGPSNEKLIGSCNPVPLTDDAGDPVLDSDGNAKNETNPDGSAVCDPNSVPQRVLAYRQANGLADGTPVPVDAVTASGSGLDPHISIANARLQAARVAKERNLSVDQVNAAIDAATSGRSLGFLGEPVVNVVTLNLSLDTGSG